MLSLNKSKTVNTLIVLFSIFPLAILAGNFFINLFIITIGSIFLIKLLKKEINFFDYRLDIYLLLFFFSSLVINLFFSNDISLSYQRVLKFLFIISFILAFKFLVKNYYSNLKKVYKLWCIFFIIVIIDLIIEFFVGKNIFGQNSIMSGRLASFTGEESVIGNFFFGFCLIFLSYTYSKSQNKILNLSIAIFFILISFLIGERANFIKTFFAITLFIFFIYEISYKIKFFSIFLILTLIYGTFLNLDKGYKVRYLNQFSEILEQDGFGITDYLDNSQYGSHRNVAKQIFLDNPIFGVGIKNFRVESGNRKYDNLDHKKNHLRVANHPHELYYEFLSETGLFGTSCFIIFIMASIFLSLKNYFHNKNLYQFSSIIFIVLSILPVIPNGSFLSTFTSSIFWINYAIMMGYNFNKS